MHWFTLNWTAGLSKQPTSRRSKSLEQQRRLLFVEQMEERAMPSITALAPPSPAAMHSASVELDKLAKPVHHPVHHATTHLLTEHHVAPALHLAHVSDLASFTSPAQTFTPVAVSSTPVSGLHEVGIISAGPTVPSAVTSAINNATSAASNVVSQANSLVSALGSQGASDVAAAASELQSLVQDLAAAARDGFTNPGQVRSDMQAAVTDLGTAVSDLRTAVSDLSSTVSTNGRLHADRVGPSNAGSAAGSLTQALGNALGVLGQSLQNLGNSIGGFSGAFGFPSNADFSGLAGLIGSNDFNPNDLTAAAIAALSPFLPSNNTGNIFDPNNPNGVFGPGDNGGGDPGSGSPDGGSTDGGGSGGGGNDPFNHDPGVTQQVD
jgi:hypothetical protein